MKLFSKLYARVMQWARHPRAIWYLGGLSFAESSFFPIPVDTMLAPMALAKPHRAWHYAMLTTVMSVLGGIIGYFIGVFFFELIEPLLHELGYWNSFLKAKAWTVDYGIWAVFLAGFSPIPYKVFTIGAGVVGMAMLPFILASIVGRGMRFFLVAALMRFGGERMERALHDYVDMLGWIIVAAALILLLIM